MGGTVMVSSQSMYSLCSPPRNPRRIHPQSSLSQSTDHLFYSSKNLKLVPTVSKNFPRINLRCNCNTGDSGENQSRTILDAFFLGKAVAEAVNERVESAVGEFLSVIGRLQAEQQKQVQEFQEDVLERAKRAKEQAAREAMEARGLIPNSTADDVNGVASSSGPIYESKPYN